MRPLILFAAFVFALLRVMGVFGLFDGHAPVLFQIFKDAAHLFVGGLIGAAMLCRWVRQFTGAVVMSSQAQPGTWAFNKSVHETEDYLKWTAIVLSVIETICAVGPRLAA